MRGRYEGLWNVVRFNWPKYALGLGVVLGASCCAWYFPSGRMLWCVFAGVAALMLLVPVLVSHRVYDRSDLYRMPWLDRVDGNGPAGVVNLNAGFDESSKLLRDRFPQSELAVIDLYARERLTEPSIARARKAYPPYPGTVVAGDGTLPLPSRSIDLAIAFLALHEVRAHADRVALLREIRRTLTPDGRLVVTEHLRDLPNALAFSIGVFRRIVSASGDAC